MASRKGISKKTRFDVFKRDGFKCLYCGAHPPAVLLHVDHINPVANGGTNAADNLATSCAACNMGKGARLLSAIPQSIAEKAMETQEREAQLLGYQAILEAKRNRLEDETWRVLRELHGDACVSVKRDDYASTKRFIETLGVHDVLDAANIALTAKKRYDKMLFRYFCGICWNKIRGTTKDA